MLKFYSLLTIGLFSLTFLGFQHFNNSNVLSIHGNLKSSSGPNGGFTGAPGESTCTQCHSGSTLDGSTFNEFSISQSGIDATQYLPDEMYDIFVNFDSGGTEKGFQITALDENDEPAGVFVQGSNTELKLGATGAIVGRRYVTHTSGTNSASGWDFTWTAPSDDVGEITFYLSTNVANNSNTAAGDMIYLSQYSLNTSAGLVEKTKLNENFKVGYSPSSHQLFINFETENSGNMHLNLTDLSGKSAFVQELGNSIAGENKQSISLPNSISSGMYIVNFFIDNKVMSAKVQITN